MLITHKGIPYNMNRRGLLKLEGSFNIKRHFPFRDFG